MRDPIEAKNSEQWAVVGTAVDCSTEARADTETPRPRKGSEGLDWPRLGWKVQGDPPTLQESCEGFRPPFADLLGCF